MRSILICLSFLFFIFTSCGKYFEQKTYKEISQVEYSRNADSDKFVKWLNDKNPNIRLKAVESLGRIQDTSTVGLLANKLSDKDVKVREAAAFAIGQLFSPSAEKYLTDAIQQDRAENFRLTLIEALGKCGTRKSFDIIKEFLDSDKYSCEKAASFACGILAYRGSPPYNNVYSMEVLLSNSQNTDVQWSSAYGLYRIGLPSSFEKIYMGINDEKKPIVRAFVIKSLIAILEVMNTQEFKKQKNHSSMVKSLKLSASPEFFNMVAKLLLNEEWYIRVLDLQLIGILKKRFFREEVIQATKDPHQYVQIEAIRTLKNFNSNLTRRELNRIYKNSNDWRIRGEALVTHAELSSREALKIIEEDLQNVKWPENYYFIKSLKSIKDKNLREKSTNLLIQLTETEVKAQKVLALEGLVDRSEIAVPFLLNMLKTGDPAIITIIATHMSFRKDPSTVEHLIDAYDDLTAPQDIEAMQQIIIALDSIQNQNSLAFLKEQLSSAYKPIRQQAYNAIVRVDTKTNIDIKNINNAALTKWDFTPIDSTIKPQINIKTSKGTIVIELFPDKAPVTVANFISLVQKGFYKGIYFHRVVPGFVIQVGDPRGDGWGGPGYSIPCEYNNTFFERGIIGMAHAGKDTGGSQFFITQLPQPHLNGHYTAFGKVIKGMDIVDQIMLFDQIENITLLNNNSLAKN